MSTQGSDVSADLMFLVPILERMPVAARLGIEWTIHERLLGDHLVTASSLFPQPWTSTLRPSGTGYTQEYLRGTVLVAFLGRIHSLMACFAAEHCSTQMLVTLPFSSRAFLGVRVVWLLF